MKPIIGVMPLFDDDKQSIWMLPAYLDVLTKNNALPFIFPQITDDTDIKQLCQKCDGFLFTGGHDVNPSLYKEEMSNLCGIPNNSRDILEEKVFNYAIKKDLAVLGICRGIQIINVLCGGSLYQDLNTEHPSNIDHHMNAPYDRDCHNVKILKDTPLFNLLQKEDLGVNSYHHQAIKELGRDLKIMAISQDELIEAVYMPGKKYIQAIQWHPEYYYLKDPNENLIIKDFINHC